MLSKFMRKLGRKRGMSRSNESDAIKELLHHRGKKGKRVIQKRIRQKLKLEDKTNDKT